MKIKSILFAINNIFRLFISHILSNQKFEQLCSYHLSERQEDLTKEFLRSNDSGLNQLYFLSFIASRGSTLEGLEYAKEFFEKLKKESENINSIGAEEAGILVKIVGFLIKLYSHTLPQIHKKFAFEYLKLEQGKFQVALSTKIAKENNIRVKVESTNMDVDFRESSEEFSDQGKYTPFLNRRVDSIIKADIPTVFKDPFKTSLKKPRAGTKSIIKDFQDEHILEVPAQIGFLEKMRM